jgi:peptide/nickel transport system permease protein
VESLRRRLAGEAIADEGHGHRDARLQLGALLSGAVITESVFAWPGIGKYAVDATLGRDYPVVQAIVLLLAVIFTTVNLAVDLLYAYLDPRIRYG